MQINNFEICNVSHKDLISYICYGKKRAFCKKCFIKHQQKCISSRCGDARKISCALLQKIQMNKIKSRLIAINPDLKQYASLKDHFASLYTNFTKILKEHIQRKVPFLTLQMQNWFLDNFIQKNKLQIPNDNSSVRIQQIKQKILNFLKQKQNKKEDLDLVIENFNTIDLLESNIKKLADLKLKNNPDGTKAGKQIKDLYIKIKSQLEENLNIRDVFDQQIEKRINLIWEKINGERKICRPSTLSYQILEGLKSSNNNEQEFRYEICLRIEQLQNSLQQLQEFGKHILKQSLFKRFKELSVRKEDEFIYRYAYVMNTSAAANNEYFERLILQSQKNYIMCINNHQEWDKKLSHICKRIIIMGQQVVQIQFTGHTNMKNQYYKINIYGYIKQRQQYYKSIPRLLGIQNCIRNTQNQILTQISFQNQLDQVYSIIIIAKLLIFNKQISILDPKILSSQGKQFILSIIYKYLETKTINVDFDPQKYSQFQNYYN